MKALTCYTALALLFATFSFSQSIIDYQAGTALVIESGADISADIVNINGTYSGGGTINGNPVNVLNLTAVLEGFYNSVSNTMVQDTVTIYLKNASPPFEIMDSARSVLHTTGAGTFIFFNVAGNSKFFVVVKHRNSLETWSSSTISFSSGALTYDFTPSANTAFGDNQVRVDNSPVRFAIYSGDVNQDGIVDAGDISPVDNDAYNSISGYVRTDVNGDNIVDALDLNIVDLNSYQGAVIRSPITGDPAINVKRETSNVRR